MRKFLLPVLAVGGAAVVAAAGAPALARDGQVHVLTVALPGGGVEQIQYTGDVAPQVVLVPSGTIVAAPMPRIVAGPLMAFDPFATLARISALMDEKAAAMLRQVDAMPRTMMPGLPQGASGYSFASMMSGNGVCTHSVQITYDGNAAPKMISSTSGDCGPGHGAAAAVDHGAAAAVDHGAAAPVDVERQAPAPRPMQPHLIEAKATGRTQVAWNR